MAKTQYNLPTTPFTFSVCQMAGTGPTTTLRAETPFLSADGVPPNGSQEHNHEHSMPRRPRRARKQDHIPIRLPDNPSVSLRFVNVDHPSKFKDATELRESRKHVMNNYLDQERRNPNSKDARVNTISKKRKRAEPIRRDTNVANAEKPSGSPNSSTESSQCSSEDSIHVTTVSRRQTNRRRGTEDEASPQIRFADDVAPLVKGISGGFNNSRYLRALAHEIPDPIAYIGSNLNPFDTWPTFDDPSLNVEQLKWSCSRKFGSQGLTAHWVPTLLKAKHAFLSTICISASHDDIMCRGALPPEQRRSSPERWKVKQEVVAMINHAVQDPETATADATIVAIVHVLNSDVMGCSDDGMRAHAAGLRGIVEKRGGLERLGVDGQLASVLTSTMYMIAVLRESEPHLDFARYAASLDTSCKAKDDHTQLPESPVYCRPSGYHTIHRSIPKHSPTSDLLEKLRTITHTFVRIHDPKWDKPLPSIADLQYQIFLVESAQDQTHVFGDMSSKYTFEALRLAGQVYAHALANSVPFSKAAAELAGSTGKSWHMLIKDALICTNLSDCWGHAAGVLFWITLVAGACGNPDVGNSPTNPAGERSGEEEEARKWLAAVTVRCSIVLGFEYGAAIMETLKRIVGLEKALREADEERERVARGFDMSAYGFEDVVTGMGGMFGPMEVPTWHMGMRDFALDLEKLL